MEMEAGTWKRVRGSGYVEAEAYGRAESRLRKNRKLVRVGSVYIYIYIKI